MCLRFRHSFSQISLTLVAVLTIGARASSADTLLFEDTGDTLSVVSTSSRISGGCNDVFEECNARISAPPGYRFAFSTFFDTFPRAGLGVGFNLAEPGGQFVSDSVWTPTSEPSTLLLVGFASDIDGAPPILCSTDVYRCQVIEDGTVQTVGSVTWMPISGIGAFITDSAQVQSDVDVPEPWSIALFGPLAACVVLRWNRCQKTLRRSSKNS
jgi:hypothetical protein